MKIADCVVEASREALILTMLKLSFAGHGFWGETFENLVLT